MALKTIKVLYHTRYYLK